jgi:hypothetical protein
VTPSHPDDELHPPTSDDPTWSETCWFAVAVPDRKLSAWFYPFFQPNLGVLASGVYIWDHTGDAEWNCLYQKNFWHLPIPDQPLSDITFANGLRYTATEPRSTYTIGYDDPDGEGVAVDLTFTGLMAPAAMSSHLDQPGLVTGTITIGGERIEVDAVGMRDRSWGPRPQTGIHLMSHGPFTADRMGYSWAASRGEAFLTISAYDGRSSDPESFFNIHGFLLRDGTSAKLSTGTRHVLQRDRATGAPTRLLVEGTDERGRTFEAEGVTHNRIGVMLNPKLFSWAALTEWRIGGATVWGEDHDNYSAASIRAYARRGLATRVGAAT